MLRKRKSLSLNQFVHLRTRIEWYIEENDLKARSRTSDWSQFSVDDENCERIVRDYIGKEIRNLLLHNLVHVEPHKDRLNKNVYCFVIFGSEKMFIHESGRSLPLLTGSIFTLNDHNDHGIYHIHDDAEYYDEAWILTAD